MDKHESNVLFHNKKLQLLERCFPQISDVPARYLTFLPKSCGKKFGAGSRTRVKSGRKTSTTISKVNGKTLNPKKYYKIYVAAYKMKNGKKITIAKSLTFHVAGSKNKIYTNVKSVKIKKNSYTIKKGSAIRIKPKRFRYDREKQFQRYIIIKR